MIDSAVIRQLQPFIVTSWHGHRDDVDVPRPVREVWDWKFQVLGGMRQSNVDLAVLDPGGKVIHSFDAFDRFPARPGENLAQYTARELQRGFSLLELDDLPARQNPLALPDLEGKQGIRIFVTLKDDRLRAYQAPIVEVVAFTPEDQAPLAYPRRSRQIEADSLHTWLSQVYPPGIMERTNPRTKEAYTISSTTGTLSLAPVKNKDGPRQAILSGIIRLHDVGGDGFRYQGQLDIVLTYPPGDDQPDSLKGLFQGTNPRRDRAQNRSRMIPLEAVFESIPGR